eukprot:scaffold33679_cov57-Attheya_sp.AAC.2
MSKGLGGVRLEKANASNSMDKLRILNSIIGNTLNNLETKPPTSHAAYDEVNALLRGKFALSAYRHALESREDMSDYRTAISQAPLRRLEISFHDSDNIVDGSNLFVTEAERFVKVIPRTVEELDLDFKNNKFLSSYDFFDGFRYLQELSRDSFYQHAPRAGLGFFSNYEIYSSCGIENVIASNPKLRSLEINFRSTRITDLTAIINSVNTLERLEVFKLDVGFNGQITEIGWDANSTTPLTSCLRKLTISFQYSDQLMEASINRFFKALRHYSKLDELRLTLTFQESTGLTSLASLAKSIRNLPLLEVVYFNFAGCPKLGDKEVVRFCRSLTGMYFTCKELSFRESCSEKLSDALKTIKTIPDLQNALLN